MGIETPSEFCDAAFDPKLDLMEVCAKMVCRPCLDGIEFVRKDGHLLHFVSPGTFIYCSAAAINALMEQYAKTGRILFSRAHDLPPLLFSS